MIFWFAPQRLSVTKCFNVRPFENNRRRMCRTNWKGNASEWRRNRSKEDRLKWWIEWGRGMPNIGGRDAIQRYSKRHRDAIGAQSIVQISLYLYNWYISKKQSQGNVVDEGRGRKCEKQETEMKGSLITNAWKEGWHCQPRNFSSAIRYIRRRPRPHYCYLYYTRGGWTEWLDSRWQRRYFDQSRTKVSPYTLPFPNGQSKPERVDEWIRPAVYTFYYCQTCSGNERE